MARKTSGIEKSRIKRFLSYPLEKKDTEQFADLESTFVSSMILNHQGAETVSATALHFEGRKLSEPARLPLVHDTDEEKVANEHAAKRNDRETRHSPRQKSHSTNIPPLPSINKHSVAMKYPLASKYFSKWQHRNRSTTANMLAGIDIINEEGNWDGCETPKTVPLDLLNRFPSSPEFTAVLRDICNNNKSSQE